MIESNIKTPGVYINEVNAFPNPVVPVPTSVPAFIGYTPQATYEGKPYTNKPYRISSFADFQAIFCYPDPALPADPAKQYSPQYYLEVAESKPATGDYVEIDGSFYTISPDPNTIYYLYNSIRLFYDNGGQEAYIVSVGIYGTTSGKPMSPSDQVVNQNVKLNELKKGLEALKRESEPTMYICPEATLLSVANNSTLMQLMLTQCEEMETAISIFDVVGGRNPHPIDYTNDIETFRDNTGSQGLKYGAAYYPFIGTTVMQSGHLDYTNLFGGDIKQLAPLLSPADNPNNTVESIIKDIENPSGTPLTVSQYNSSLLVASPTYSTIMKHVLADVNILPSSGGMAGVITTVDNQSGPWQSPANRSIIGAVSLPIRISDEQQQDLNVDAVSGKSINAIRFFNGQGILVWGARTLDGNSMDWRYISVRRTITFLEQSCAVAARVYIFQANDANTWESIKSMISSFLNTIWQEGGLQGASAADAYSVACGLGTTMTPEDILNGFMKVTIKVAVSRPAEYIVITLEQEMAKS